MTNELATHQKPFDLSPQNFEQALTFAGYLAESTLVPKEFLGKPGNCLIAIQWGMELGLKPLQCMQNIAVINGRPSLWGDAVMALVLASPQCKDVVERFEGDGDNYAAVCIAQRHGKADKVSRFSLKDAKDAGLLGKQGPWQQYRDRMLKMRARAFALRDQFADVLKGMQVAEELMDTPAERHLGMAEQVATANLPADKGAERSTYPDDKFAENLPKWREVMAANRKTPDQIITMAETKHPLTDAQKLAIRGDATAAKTKADTVTDAGPVVTYAEVADKLHKATNTDQLADAADLIGAVADPGQRTELTTIFNTRTAKLAN